MDIYSKFDLHIHSKASAKTKTGDRAIVENSDIENIEVLIQKLVDNDVNMVAVTDHNIFDAALYEELKKQEEANNQIFKVLPGVEIDLEIEQKNVHVVCIFDDEPSDHIQKIEKGFKQQNKYSVDELGAVLRKIELGVVLIAHQKCDYLSDKPQKTSLSYAGKENFYKFVGCEFFDALEIQNTKVEGILKSRFFTDDIADINLIAGSDCHEWIAYPAHHAGKIANELMYMKALPTFLGLVMAITDTARMYRDEEMPKEEVLKEITIEIDGEEKHFPLSDKINVIIGDNSVGKSTLVKYLSGKVEKPAMDFLENHKVRIMTRPLDDKNLIFSGQGKIREMFEESDERLSIQEKFKGYFKEIEIDKYKGIVGKIIVYYYNIWEKNEQIYNNARGLERKLSIPIFNESDKHYLSIERNISTENSVYKELVSILENLYIKFRELNNYLKIMEREDIDELHKVRQTLANIGIKYEEKSKKEYFAETIRNVFDFVAKDYSDNISKKMSSDEMRLNTFREEYQRVINCMCMDLEHKFTTIPNVWDEFQEFKIKDSINSVGKYCFVSKVFKKEIIDKQLIVEFIRKFLDTSRQLEELTSSEVISYIKGKNVLSKSADNVKEFLRIIYNGFCQEYMKLTVEIKKGDDILSESNSAGINALYYLDILSETYQKPIFIIDQPEDDVSQSRIASNLISSLRNLARKSQVIIVTHNPQLVVNLDADNVIVIKKEDSEIEFYSGPLEYVDGNVAILDLVANTLDGGADVIRKRWKRYEKTGL